MILRLILPHKRHDMIKHFDNKLATFIQSITMPATQIREAIEYVLFPGGKRLRPQLVYLTGVLLQVPESVLDHIAIAIELMHNYSLVHDDLPAMDNDDLRRGRPTCHRAFDEACAILTGDALQSLAITALTTCPQVKPQTLLNMITGLIDATGPTGMISGQVLDLSLLSGKIPVSESQLAQIHHLKTTALIQACIRLPLEAAPQDLQHHADSLLNFGQHLGLAYQMQDDYLDAYAYQSLGKQQASDQANEKQTFSTLYPQDKLLHLIQKTFEKAKFRLQPFGEKADALIDLTNQLHRV